MNFYRQTTSNDCGATALRIVLSYFNRDIPQWEILNLYPMSKDGWSIKVLMRACNHFGLSVRDVTEQFEDIDRFQLPLIVLSNRHYIVIYKIKRNVIYIADPRIGKCNYTISEFRSIIDEDSAILQISQSVVNSEQKSSSWLNLIKEFTRYYSSYKQEIFRIFIVIGITCLAQLALPFVTRAIIDSGIETSSWDYIKILVVACLLLCVAIVTGSFFQTYVFSHIANRVKSLMLDDYFAKILQLKYVSFIGLNVGDLLQRVSDNERIQSYIINSLLQAVVSFFLLLIFSVALAIFSVRLGAIFVIISVLYIGWNLIFLNQRKKLDFNFWKVKSENNKQIIHSFLHITDIKTHGLEELFQQKWRANLFQIFDQNTRFLKFSQIQETGNRLLIYINNLTLTFISCYYVIEGAFTLGTLFAVQYLIGVISSPLNVISEFLNQSQLTLISLQRISTFNHSPLDKYTAIDNTVIPKRKDINIQGIVFRYPNGKIALSHVSIYLKYGEKYGIIGQSGCGKSTLLKIIGGLLEPTIGNYLIGTTNAASLGLIPIRQFIASCLQEDSLIQGSILQNIVGTTNDYNEDKLIKVVEIASIRREIEALPNSYNTVINRGNDIFSKGQQQRILIARTLYLDADIYLFDEITNCLDESMGHNIIHKIDAFLESKTRIYVTHQQDYLKDASRIYRLQSGCLINAGTYEELMEKKE